MVKRSQPKRILAMQDRKEGEGNQGVTRSGTMRGARTDVHPEVDTAFDTAREEPWTILVHNDDVTPYDFVVDTLSHVFSLSAEIAETVTWEAHHKGVAPVCSRPQSEAKRLISDAHTLARAAGYPLTFSMEPKQ
ncbi:MAG: ATP-dependent Clp protease adaptor ClpS [Caldilineaceae bacterium]|nr:ATP-dependent Clp protease adaptor ClpS [Caldilineaceae bacterium]